MRITCNDVIFIMEIATKEGMSMALLLLLSFPPAVLHDGVMPTHS